MREMKVKLTFIEPVLGTSANNKQVYSDFIASKAPEGVNIEEEIDALGVDAVTERGTTVFPRLDDDTPFIWDYQIRGFFKEACAALRTVKGMKSVSIKAYKKEIDKRVFVVERRVPFLGVKDVTYNERPLRAQTMQGERISLARSEQINDGSTIEFTIMCLNDDMVPVIEEWLDYGKLSGMLQWRNAGYGRFTWEYVA